MEEIICQVFQAKTNKHKNSWGAWECLMSVYLHLVTTTVASDGIAMMTDRVWLNNVVMFSYLFNEAQVGASVLKITTEKKPKQNKTKKNIGNPNFFIYTLHYDI